MHTNRFTKSVGQYPLPPPTSEKTSTSLLYVVNSHIVLNSGDLISLKTFFALKVSKGELHVLVTFLTTIHDSPHKSRLIAIKILPLMNYRTFYF